MAAPLYRRHSAGLAATYAELENHAQSQGQVLIGTPGSIALRTNGSGVAFYARQFYDFEGRKRDQYIAGQPDSEATQRLLEEWRARLADTSEAIRVVRLLGREGYATVTPRHFAALAPLANHGVFSAGGLLVGAYAFGAIVNRLGVRVEAFGTEDVDIARPSRLALEGVPEGGLLAMLRESGIDFVEVPPLDHRSPSTKFKERGRSRFTFDLLVPASGSEVETVYVPELSTHATALPYFRYLLGEPQDGIVMSSHGVMPVRIPSPERFAVHKLMVSQMRKGRAEKSLKDLRQAAALIAAMAELHPGSIASAMAKTPVSARRLIGKSIDQIRGSLEAHPQALEELSK